MGGDAACLHIVKLVRELVLRGARPVRAVDLPDIAFCKQRMAAYKYPRSIELVTDLPKTVTGKILRRELRDKERGAPTEP